MSDYVKISPDLFIATALKVRALAKKRGPKVVAQRPAKRTRLECNIKERIELDCHDNTKEDVRIVLLATQTRSGRVVKRTSKVRS
jgi:hypothetical protein